jgi:hypothetical protein
MQAPRSAALLLSGLLWATAVPAQDGKYVASPQHVKAKVTCFDCHGKENPTKAAVASDSCMTCHGDFPAMEDFTKQLAPNPHKLTPAAKGTANCTDCHRQHKKG